VLGTVPRALLAANVPFVSANAERLAMPPDAALQFGVVPVNLADGIASKLRAETGLRVTASSACWMDFEAHPSDKYDAALCPSLRPDPARWDEIAATFTAAYRKPFTVAAARGYAAMQVALATVKQMRAGAKPATVFHDVKEVSTVLGRVRYQDTSVPDDAMQLVLAPKLPRVSPREAGVLDELLKSKGCGCKAGACPSATTWNTMPFVVKGGGVRGEQRREGVVGDSTPVTPPTQSARASCATFPIARFAAAVRVSTASFSNTCSRCFFTVAGLEPRMSPMSRLVLPFATQ
jgi:hypothetical protein